MMLPYTPMQQIAYGLSCATWVERELDWKPDPWQRRAMQSRKDLALATSRQIGKSQSTAAIAAHTALFNADQTIVVVSPGQRQSQLHFRRTSRYIKQSLAQGVKLPEDNALSLTLPNGSRVVSLPASESSIRGFSVTLLIIDEASRVSDDIFYSIRPTVAATKGRTIIMSSPFGQTGFFADVALGADMSWDRFIVPVTECPRIDQEFLDKERELLGEQMFNQEYMVDFLASAGLAFDQEAVADAFGDRTVPDAVHTTSVDGVLKKRRVFDLAHV